MCINILALKFIQSRPTSDSKYQVYGTVQVTNESPNKSATHDFIHMSIHVQGQNRNKIDIN